MDRQKIRIGGLYSCCYPLELWTRHGVNREFHQLMEDMSSNKPFAILEIDDKLLEHSNIYQLKILTEDGTIRWIDVDKTNSSIKPLDNRNEV